MEKLEVGKLFKDGVTRYREGVKFDITDSGCNLFIYFDDPTKEELDSISRGEIKYGYYKENNVLLLLFKFGTIQWIDAPYSIHLSNNLTKIQEIEDGKGFATTIYLIDAATGILKSIRYISFNTRFSRMLKEDLQKQKEMSNRNFDMYLSNIYMKYTTNNLVKLAKVTGKID